MSWGGRPQIMSYGRWLRADSATRRAFNSGLDACPSVAIDGGIRVTIKWGEKKLVPEPPGTYGELK